MRRLFGALGSNSEGTNSYWLMLWAIVESGKLEKKKVRRNLFGVLIYFGLIMFMDLYKFSRLVMHLNSFSMNLGHDRGYPESISSLTY